MVKEKEKEKTCFLYSFTVGYDKKGQTNTVQCVLTAATNVLEPGRASSERDLSMGHNLSDFQGLKWEVLGANPVKMLKELSCCTTVLFGCCSEMLDCRCVFLIHGRSKMQAFHAACSGSSALALKNAEWSSATHSV